MNDSKTIVHLIENCLDSKLNLFDECYFDELAPKLTVDSFNEVAEELAANNKCGYFLCPNVLPSELLTVKQRYKIVHNQIFDISQRKWFCSDRCFKIFHSVLDQLDELPNPKLCLKFPKTNGECIAKKEIKTGDKVYISSSDDVAETLERLKIDRHEKVDRQQNRVLIEEMTSYDVGSPSESQTDESEVSDNEADMKYEFTNNKRNVKNYTKSTSTEERLDAIREKYFDKASGHLVPKRKMISIVDAKPESSSKSPRSSHPVAENMELSDLKPLFIEWLDDCADDVFVCSDLEQSTSKSIVDDQGCSRKKMEADFRKKVDQFFKGDFIKLSENDIVDGSYNSKTVILPFIDSEDQMLQRRKIVLNQLKKRLVEACEIIDMKQDYAWAIIRTIVPKLKLKATNVMLNSREWRAVCVALLFPSKYFNDERINEKIREISSKISFDLSFLLRFIERAKN